MGLRPGSAGGVRVGKGRLADAAVGHHDGEEAGQVQSPVVEQAAHLLDDDLWPRRLLADQDDPRRGLSAVLSQDEPKVRLVVCDQDPLLGHCARPDILVRGRGPILCGEGHIMTEGPQVQNGGPWDALICEEP